MRVRFTSRTILAAALVAALFAPGAAHAQDAPAAQPDGAIAAPAGAEVDENYNSPMRGQCMAELRKDTAWQAAIKKDLRLVIHNEEHDLIAANKRHVFMAYSALWILVVVFVVLTWRKQRALKTEVDRLEAELERATVDERS